MSKEPNKPYLLAFLYVPKGKLNIEHFSHFVNEWPTIPSSKLNAPPLDPFKTPLTCPLGQIQRGFEPMRGQEVTYFERQRIEFYLKGKLSKRQIAKYLYRDHSVVVREIARNKGPDGKYRAEQANKRAEVRKNKIKKKKLDQDDALKNYVTSKLIQEYSPNVIAGILKNRLEPLMIGKSISHEAIYQYIYEGQGRFMGLYQYLARKHKKRTRQRARKGRKDGQIQYTTPIKYRSKEINERSTFGHWESDTVECVQGNLSVQIERKTRLLRVHKVNTKYAEETKNALIKTLESLPQASFQSITFDNGTEGAHHWKLRMEYGIETYFCKPYSSWQKGSVENVNGILRRYFPRNINLQELTDYDIYLIQEKINNRPRKILGYRSPNQVAKELIGKEVVH